MTLFPTFNPDTGLHEIWVRDDGMRAMPAGPRIFRANPPAATFEHESRNPPRRRLPVSISTSPRCGRNRAGARRREPERDVSTFAVHHTHETSRVRTPSPMPPLRSTACSASAPASPLDESWVPMPRQSPRWKTAIDLRERLDFVMRPPVPAACVSSGKLEDSHAICAAVDAFSSRIREIEVIPRRHPLTSFGLVGHCVVNQRPHV